MFEFLGLLGGFWFFLFVCFIIVVGGLSSENDSLIGAVATFIALIAGFILFGIPVFSTAVEYIAFTVLLLVAYIVIGLVYAIYFKFPDFLKSKSENIKTTWNNWKQKYPDGTREEFLKSGDYMVYTPYHNNSSITVWTALWPWGLAWDLIHKPVKFIYNSVYDIAGKMLDGVTKRVTSKIIDE